MRSDIVQGVVFHDYELTDLTSGTWLWGDGSLQSFKLACRIELAFWLKERKARYWHKADIDFVAEHVRFRG